MKKAIAQIIFASLFLIVSFFGIYFLFDWNAIFNEKPEEINAVHVVTIISYSVYTLVYGIFIYINFSNMDDTDKWKDVGIYQLMIIPVIVTIAINSLFVFLIINISMWFVVPAIIWTIINIAVAVNDSESTTLGIGWSISNYLDTRNTYITKIEQFDGKLKTYLKNYKS